jgi:hypothetical protein
MPRDPRARVEEAEPVLPRDENYEYASPEIPFDPGEAEIATTGENGERNAAFNKAMRDYAPEFVQPTAHGNYLFNQDDLIRGGLSDAEIIALQREGAAAGNGGLREYDETVEAERLHMKRSQAGRIAVIDSGSSVRLSLSESEAYFAGQVPNAGGKYCKRLPYVSPTDETVGINGYIFRIPKYRRVMLPTEVLAILYQAGKARQQYDVLSAIYTARQYRPISATENGDPQGYAAAIAASHKVREDLIPGGAFPGR